MKILFIGGTGNISSACTKLALDEGFEVCHINRGIAKNLAISEVHSLISV